MGLVLGSYGNTHHSKAPQSISIFVPIPLLLVQELAGQAGSRTRLKESYN